MPRLPSAALLALLCAAWPVAAAGAVPDDPGLERVRTVVSGIERFYPAPVDLPATVARGVEAVRREAQASPEAFGRCMGPGAGREAAPDSAARLVSRAVGCAGQAPERSEALIDEALRAMVGGLDRESRYYGPQDMASLRALGSAGATGLVVEKLGQAFRIVSTRPGSPARAAGLAGGEILLAIDGAPIASRSFDEIGKMLAGTAGSRVRLTLGDGRGAGRDIELDRVRSDSLPDVEAVVRDGVLVLSLYALGSILEYHVRRAVAAEEAPFRAVLIDLRSNRGGIFDQAWAIPDAFLEDGLIVTTRGARNRKRNYRARKGSTMPDVPVVVLVNQDTAAGAEVVAAALQDNKRAIVAGRTTSGASSIQSLIPLSPERAYRLTTAYAYRPDGRALAEAPVVPDCPSAAHGEAALRQGLALAAGDRSACAGAP
ncbi:MAG TPA: S41 family peptidase [Allosphingosinicella sp.]|jgi:C-terminal peptidase prc|nr:S41 family peptidase [Allosphingosinicella sp.]